MKSYYLTVAGEGFGLCIIPVLALLYVALLALAVPFFLIGIGGRIVRGLFSLDDKQTA